MHATYTCQRKTTRHRATTLTCLEPPRAPSPSESLLCLRLSSTGGSRRFDGEARDTFFKAASSSGTRNKDVCMTCIFWRSTPISRAHGMRVGSAGRWLARGEAEEEASDSTSSSTASSSSESESARTPVPRPVRASCCFARGLTPAKPKRMYTQQLVRSSFSTFPSWTQPSMDSVVLYRSSQAKHFERSWYPLCPRSESMVS